MAFRKIQTTNLISTETSFDDPVLIVNKTSAATDADIGFLAKRGINTYSGIVRDGDDSKFYVVESVTLASASTNNVVPAQVTVGTLVGNLEGNIVDSAGNTVISNSGTFVPTTFALPKGTTLQRPASPQEGEMFFNTDTKMFEGWNGTAWVQLIPSTYVETP